MDPSLVAAFAAAGAAVAAAMFSLIALPFTIRAAKAASVQTELQSRVAAEARHPMLWADIRPDPDRSMVLCLMLGNSGPTTARDVKVVITPAVLPGVHSMRCEEAQADGAAGIASVGPGRTMLWSLGMAHELLSVPDQPEQFTLTVTGRASDGTSLVEQFSIRFRDFRFTSAVPSVGESFVQEFRHFRRERRQDHRALLDSLQEVME